MAIASPMFPLGGPLLPGSVLPLQIFEPRYLEMIDRCLVSAEPSFGVVMIDRGHEVGGGDVRSDVGTLARIVEVRSLPDGRLAVLVVGVRRIRVIEWLVDDPHPMAVIEEFPDDDDAHDLSVDDIEKRTAALDRALALSAQLMGTSPERPDLSSLEPTDVSFALGALAPLGPADRQRLLKAGGVDERLRVFDEVIAEVCDAMRFRLETRGDDA
ncbi:MAG: LON peptidase substrate-binding domain-containing protein [Ilumatobacteraceae bacterium]